VNGSNDDPHVRRVKQELQRSEGKLLARKKNFRRYSVYSAYSAYSYVLAV